MNPLRFIPSPLTLANSLGDLTLMKLRRFFPIALFTVLAIPAAHAAGTTDDATFQFTPTGGAAINFSLGTPTTYYPDPGGVAFYFGVPSNQGDLVVDFISAEYASSLLSQGYGSVDLELYNGSTGDTYLLDGPQIFSGDPSDPIFTPETLTVTPDPSGIGLPIGGKLVVDGGGVSATPEPSSLALLGTAVLSLAGTIRRRSRKP